jgi:hypothetical protein
LDEKKKVFCGEINSSTSKIQQSENRKKMEKSKNKGGVRLERRRPASV